MKKLIYLACGVYNMSDGFGRFDIPYTAHSNLELAKIGMLELYIKDLKSKLQNYKASYKLHKNDLTKRQKENHEIEIDRLEKLIEEIKATKVFPEEDYSVLAVTMDED